MFDCIILFTCTRTNTYTQTYSRMRTYVQTYANTLGRWIQLDHVARVFGHAPMPSLLDRPLHLHAHMCTCMHAPWMQGRSYLRIRVCKYSRNHEHINFRMHMYACMHIFTNSETVSVCVPVSRWAPEEATNPTTNQLTNQPTNQPANQPTNQPTSQSTNQPNQANQPTTNQPTNQPTN